MTDFPFDSIPLARILFDQGYLDDTSSMLERIAGKLHLENGDTSLLEQVAGATEEELRELDPKEDWKQRLQALRKRRSHVVRE